MKFSVAIDDFIADWRAQGRLTSDGSERAYRDALMRHADDVGNRDPAYTNRNDVRQTLRRWTHPNTQANRRAILASFYDWCMEEGLRPDNPARQTPRPRKRKAQVYRLTRDEAVRVLQACDTPRERRAIYLMACAGLRNQELRGMQGRHFDRPGFVWVSPDIGKGGRERWLPVIPELAPVVAEIQEHVAPDEYVVPRQRVFNLDRSRPPEDVRDQPCSSQTVGRIVERVGLRAGIPVRLNPHALRHAYGDHIAKYAGIKVAQYLMGHAEVSTTQTYTGDPTLDELVAALDGFSFERHTNRRSRWQPSMLELQEYRHGDSNPGSASARMDAEPAADSHETQPMTTEGHHDHTASPAHDLDRRGEGEPA